MLKLCVLGSSSSGNCYLLQAENETLILDCGIDIKKIMKGLNYNILNVAAVLCTHSHKDHSLSVKDFEDMGIPVIKFYEEPYKEYVREKQYKVTDKDGKEKVVSVFYTAFINIGNFKVMGIQVPHNGTENYGFIIRVEEQAIFYFTDFEYCTPVLASYRPNHIICECNYQQELVSRDLPQYEHKIKGHCSLETCKNFIVANKTNALRNVILCHLGAETTIAEQCVAEVQKVANCPVYVAEKGMEIELSLYLF